MPPEDIRRRRVLELGAGAGGALVGLASTTPASATDSDCGCDESGSCHQCWVDVKPGSCPNAINRDSNGVVSVAAGQPDMTPDTTRLVPTTGDWGDCSERQSDDRNPGCEAAKARLESCDGAEPVRWETYDEDGDGDLDKVFKFRVQDLDLREEHQSLLLVGCDGHDGETIWGVDSVKVVTSGGNGGRGGGRDEGRGRGRGRGN